MVWTLTLGVCKLFKTEIYKVQTIIVFFWGYSLNSQSLKWNVLKSEDKLFYVVKCIKFFFLEAFVIGGNSPKCWFPVNTT